MPPEAGTSSGRIWASAPITVSAMRKPERPRAATGEGGAQFTIERSGVSTRIGRKKPALWGMSPSKIALTQAQAAEAVKG